ncbi:hypothetical protein C7T35_01335 [Variovorax sp. WS11]|uniref:nuclease domain-containing protein n=1 Tax=Variovorax sp. WS11 TaxID=1105204 RepID=UPI000D0CB066|nr:nuclease domain-containing protein [Variovorax sp. WS11]NDZ11504.1 DUF1364 domain-containing protein [Variovorax sp. WS11]PSL86640.1 hypothetical protein C7T35_01335 [Variovorax sp. WS11]
MLRRTGFKRHVYTPPPAPPTTRATRTAVLATCAAPAQTIAKQPRAENRHLLDMAQGQPCLIRSPICCGDPETTVACHGAGVRNGKGMGYKVGDHFTAAGCYRCNHYTDAYAHATAEEKEAAFMLGHLRQVEVWRAIVADPGQPARDRAAAQWALDHLNASPVGLESPL